MIAKKPVPLEIISRNLSNKPEPFQTMNFEVNSKNPKSQQTSLIYMDIRKIKLIQYSRRLFKR